MVKNKFFIKILGKYWSFFVKKFPGRSGKKHVIFALFQNFYTFLVQNLGSFDKKFG